VLCGDGDFSSRISGDSCPGKVPGFRVKPLYGTIAAHVVVRFGTYEISLKLGEVRIRGVKIRIHSSR
jgi:hypothetical protein